MRNQDCREIILIGETAIYNQIKRFLRTKEGEYELSFLRSDNAAGTVRCEQKRNETESYETSVFEELINLTEPTLVINCGCYYIYPGSLIRKENLTLINFHNGLLPAYRGLNIPSWVIYNREKEGGVTWHRIREKIDGGEILKRGSVLVEKDEKVYQLCRKLFALGYDLFLELWNEWERGTLEAIDTENSSGEKSHFYYRKDIPNGGIIDLKRDRKDVIYNVLRAMDYGKASPFPSAVLVDEEKRYLITGYHKSGENWSAESKSRHIFKIELEDTYLFVETVKEEENGRKSNEHT